MKVNPLNRDVWSSTTKCHGCSRALDEQKAAYWEIVAHAEGEFHKTFLCHLCVPDEVVGYIACTADIPGFWKKKTKNVKEEGERLCWPA